MGAERIGELAALATALMWTLSALAWTSAGKHIGSLAVSFLRLALTCVFLAVYGGAVRGLWLPTDASAEAWVILGLSGFAGFFLSDLCLFKAYLVIGPRLTLLMQSLTPPAAAILWWLAGRDVLPLRHWGAMAVTLLGVAWVVLEQPEDPEQRLAPHHLRQGLWLAVLAALGQAVGLVLSKQGLLVLKLEGLLEYDAMAATFIRVLGGMAGFLILLTLTRRWPDMARAAQHGRVMLIVLAGSFVGPFLGVALCMIALRHCHPGVAATIISTMPVLILPFVVLLYREKVTMRAAGGAVLSVIGVALLAI